MLSAITYTAWRKVIESAQVLSDGGASEKGEDEEALHFEGDRRICGGRCELVNQEDQLTRVLGRRRMMFDGCKQEGDVMIYARG